LIRDKDTCYSMEDKEKETEQPDAVPAQAAESAEHLRNMGLANHHHSPRSFGK